MERKKSKRFQGVYYRVSTDKKHLGNVTNNMGDSADVNIRQTPSANGGQNFKKVFSPRLNMYFFSYCIL